MRRRVRFGNSGVLAGVNNETLTLAGAGTLSSKNVGTEVAFAAGGLAGLTLIGNGTALASNYTLAGGFDWVTITPATLNVVGTRPPTAPTTARPWMIYPAPPCRACWATTALHWERRDGPL